ncbi:MAG TPA: hypothetical protein VGW38_29030, partial [Chloroflexota bacterium]|nr:hypothetical protein [Chloroflexota bacterium]
MARRSAESARVNLSLPFTWSGEIYNTSTNEAYGGSTLTFTVVDGVQVGSFTANAIAFLCLDPLNTAAPGSMRLVALQIPTVPIDGNTIDFTYPLPSSGGVAASGNKVTGTLS